jgi:DNA (cytosine-5)-methyltransferase 1
MTLEQRSGRKVLSLFSGMGGLDLGACLAGLEISVAVDADDSALKVLRRAMGTKTVVGYTQQLSPEQVIEDAGLRADGSAILIGGPPCTAFSHAGFWLERKRNGSDSQAERISDYWRYITVLNPAAFVMENVPGLAFENHKSVLASLVNRARRMGYSVVTKILDASHYGVPQARRRLFVVGVKSGMRYEFPLPTFAEQPRTARWAFTGLRSLDNPTERDEKLTGQYSGLLPLIPPGDNYLYFTKERGYPKPRFGWRKRYWSFLLKLHPNKPSPTIAATRVHNNGPFHWRNRRLRIRELARLQTFPDLYPLADHVLARRHIGNAVPPLLSAQIFCSLREALGDTTPGYLPEHLAEAVDADASCLDVSAAMAKGLRAGGH